ncbi:hypothetical protein EMIT0162MI3_20155 [Pseudomonas chlororaphis]
MTGTLHDLSLGGSFGKAAAFINIMEYYLCVQLIFPPWSSVY